MKFYQCYGINIERDVAFAADILCASDADAEREAREKLADYPAVELWDAGRLVCRLIRIEAATST